MTEIKWQPIETAPRDGTSILIYLPQSTRQNVREASWAMIYEDAPIEHCYWMTPVGPTGRGYTILETGVTHWMPMPPPPENDK